MPKDGQASKLPLSPAERISVALGQLYTASAAGTSATTERDFLVDLKKLLRAADCEDGDARDQALEWLRQLDDKILRLEGPRRDADIIHRVRVPREWEAAFFSRLGEDSPAQRRAALARQFEEAASVSVPERWREAWRAWCLRLGEAARAGDSITPFDRESSQGNAQLLALLPKLLAWEGESLLRFASCVLCGESKRLEALTAKVNRLLNEITGGAIPTLDDIGIIPNPRSALAHGPLRLKLDGEWLDLGRLHGVFRLSQSDIERAEAVDTAAVRCLTVENETSFHELAKLRSGVLLVQTSYPGSATLALLKRLPATLEFHHFGDSDDAGFEILRDLRERSGCDFQALHMERGRANFEQESLGRPQPDWPFYS